MCLTLLQRICNDEQDEVLSEVISSASGLSQYQSVAVQTESLQNLVKPPPGFQNAEDNKNAMKVSLKLNTLIGQLSMSDIDSVQLMH